MNKLLLALALTVSTSVFAESSKWNSLELTKHTIKVDGMNSFQGYEIKGTTLLSEEFLISVSKTKVGSDITIQGYSMDAEVNVLELGIGGRAAITKHSDFYAMFSYMDVSNKVSLGKHSASVDDSATGLKVGVRSMVSDVLELSTYAERINMDDDHSTALNVTADYHFTDWSLGLGYTKDSDEKGSAITAKMYF